MPQFIYTMKDLRKVTPQGKEILKGIWLSFYGDAKIGVLGHNGAGKSTVLRIMACSIPGKTYSSTSRRPWPPRRPW
jgi:ATPase subunit of ABC transporter with duplicated ATPase domains